MSNIPSTLLDDMDGNASARHVLFNENMDAVSPAAIFGRHGADCAALTWAYYGGVYDIAGTPTVIADGTLALTDNATCYVRVTKATGVVDFATSAPSGWPGPMTAYTALHEVTTLAGVVTASVDYRNIGARSVPQRQHTVTYTGTDTFDCDAYDVFDLTLGGAGSLTFSGGYDGQKVLVRLKQDGTGSRIPTWTNVTYSVDIAAMPTLTTTINKTDVLAFIVKGAGVTYWLAGYNRGF